MNATNQTALVTTSWDDGHPLDLRIADLLEKYGLAGTFYVPRRSPHSVMTVAQLRHINRAFEIGAHTLDHVYLDRVSGLEAMRQLSGSRRWIEDSSGKPCSTVCFPGGKYKNRQLRLVQAAGFLGARTTELLSLRHPARKADLFLIPTTIQVFPHPPSTYAKNAFKRARGLHLLQSRALFYSRDWLALAKRLFSAALRRRGVFHLWGHSWEIERHRQWRALEEMLATISRHRADLRFVTNGGLCGACALVSETRAPREAELGSTNADALKLESGT